MSIYIGQGSINLGLIQENKTIFLCQTHIKIANEEFLHVRSMITKKIIIKQVMNFLVQLIIIYSTMF